MPTTSAKVESTSRNHGEQTAANPTTYIYSFQLTAHTSNNAPGHPLHTHLLLHEALVLSYGQKREATNNDLDKTKF